MLFVFSGGVFFLTAVFTLTYLEKDKHEYFFERQNRVSIY